MYNSKELILDNELTFLSYNQTINKEFTVEEIKTSPLWKTTIGDGLVRAIPLFNCDSIESSNGDDIVLENNQCVILQNVDETIVKCISNDTGSTHFYTLELYCYVPYSKLDVINELTVYCIVADEYLNTLGDVEIQVYVDDELTTTVSTDNQGIARYKVSEACTVKFMYGESESNEITISGGD